jgi:hypothetical protein
LLEQLELVLLEIWENDGSDLVNEFLHCWNVLENLSQLLYPRNKAINRLDLESCADLFSRLVKTLQRSFELLVLFH